MQSAGVRILGIGQVSLRVRDLSESIAFYGDLLGFRAENNGSSDKRVCVCGSQQTGGRPVRIMLIEGQSPTDELIRQHFVLEVPTEDDVRRIHAAARAGGYSATQPQIYFGRYQTFLFDPDGYKVGIMASEPEGQSPEQG